MDFTTLPNPLYITIDDKKIESFTLAWAYDNRGNHVGVDGVTYTVGAATVGASPSGAGQRIAVEATALPSGNAIPALWLDVLDSAARIGWYFALESYVGAFLTALDGLHGVDLVDDGQAAERKPLDKSAWEQGIVDAWRDYKRQGGQQSQDAWMSAKTGMSAKTLQRWLKKYEEGDKMS